MQGVPINPYPNDWRCDAGHGFDKPSGKGKTGRRYFKDDDGTFVHQVLLRRSRGGHAMGTGLYTRTRVVDGTITMVLLESDLSTELTREEGLSVLRDWKPQWSHVAYKMLKQVGRA
jgi:hypothetical protein